MPTDQPTAEVHPDFSDQGAAPVPWTEARQQLADAQIYWVSTVRPDGRPHVTPLIGVWLNDAMHFCTGPQERKAKNLAQNPHCVLTTGCNQYDRGLDIVIEGDAAQVTDDAKLRRLAEAYEAKYGKDWHFEVRDGGFYAEPQGGVPVFEIASSTIFGFHKGDPFSQTRWRF